MYPVLAHDLHAFLNTMALNLELLQRSAAKEEHDPETVARIRRYAALVADEIPPLDRMLKAVVGQMRLADPPTSRFDFRSLCEELAIVFDSVARYRRLKLRTTLADVPMAVAGDRDAVAHAMTALLLALLESLPAGSALALSLNADRRHATVNLSAEPPVAASAPAPETATSSSIDSAVMEASPREILERFGARVVETSGADGSFALDITVPLVPLSSS